MTRSHPTRLGPVARTRPRTPRTPRTLGTLGALVALAVVVTAGAPSVITVSSGDTLWDLAKKHGTSVSVLRELNELPGNGTIYIGEKLRVPGKAVKAVKAAPARTHVVRSGETLSHLAVRYGTTSAAIRKANAMSSGNIYVGTRLRIPGGRSAATTSVPTTNAGRAIPGAVRNSVAQNRRILASRSHPSKAQVRRMVAATARKHGVSPSLAVAVAFHESGFQQRVVSGVNAIGVMQVLPSTGRALGKQSGRSFDLLKTQDNITAGVLLLRQLVRATGSADKALAGYYQGLGSISRKGLLPQTHTYIRNVNYLRAQRFPRG